LNPYVAYEGYVVRVTHNPLTREKVIGTSFNNLLSMPMSKAFDIKFASCLVTRTKVSERFT
jgi:hypothetical protein